MKNLYILLVISLFLLSCDDNLDLDPVNTLTPEALLQDPENLDKVLVGVYAFSILEFGGEYQTTTELLAKEGNLAFRGTFAEYFEFDSKQVNAINGDI